MTDFPVQPTLPAHDYIPVGPGSDFLSELKQHFGDSNLLGIFDDTAIRTLAGFMQVYRLPAGRAMLREGEKSDFVILLLNGDVDVLKAHDDGVPQLITSVQPGKMIGEMSLVDGEPRFTTCISRTEVLFAVLTRPGLTTIIDDQPRLGAQLLLQLVALISQRLRQTSRKLVSLMARGEA